MAEQLLANLPGINARFVSDPMAAQAALQPSDLIVRIRGDRSDDQDLTFLYWQQLVRAPSLDIQLGSEEVAVGPLTIPGRPNCGYCARARMAGASAGLETGGNGPPTINHFAAAAVVAAELRTLLNEEWHQSNLLDHVTIYSLAAHRSARHRVIPAPWCDFCAGAALVEVQPIAQKLSVDDPPDVLLRALDGWVDARTGVISRLEIDTPADGGDVPVIATALPPHIVTEGRVRRFPLGWGKGLTLSAALLSAIGEATERYSASLADPLRIVSARCGELDGEFLDPREFAVYSDAQYGRADFPFVRFDPQVVHPWVQGWWADTLAPVWVPTMLAFLHVTAGPDQLFCQGTSSGLAASTDRCDASFRALLELVERDAFLTAWMTGRPGQRIEMDDTLDPRLRRVLDGVEELGAAVEIYSLTACVHGCAILCLALGDGVRYPGVTIGMAAGTNAASALSAAILELGQTGPHWRRVMQMKVVTAPENAEAVREMGDHAAYYFPIERARAFDSLRTGTERIKLRQLTREHVQGASLESFVSGLQDVGVRVAFVDVTSPDTALSPFRVVRAVSPDLQPLSYGYGLDFMPVARVRRMGLANDVPPVHPIS
jgi:ribosomal protein S12 methylthiotransferase accessory factor